MRAMYPTNSGHVKANDGRVCAPAAGAVGRVGVVGCVLLVAPQVESESET